MDVSDDSITVVNCFAKHTEILKLIKQCGKQDIMYAQLSPDQTPIL